MGLDCYWEHRAANPPKPEFNPPLQLCQWDVGASFRGGPYADVFHFLTGLSLYDSLTNDQVRMIADTLAKTEWVELPAKLRDEEVDPHFRMRGAIMQCEYTDLRRMFREYAKADYSLYASC
jgi:hypothetical protein